MTRDLLRTQDDEIADFSRYLHDQLAAAIEADDWEGQPTTAVLTPEQLQKLLK